MDVRKKFWLVLIGAVAGLAIIACSCGSLIPTTKPTLPPVATYAPVVTQAPLATSDTSGQEAIPGLAGAWIDPDSSGGGTISTIAWVNGGYAVTSVINTGRGPNELTKTSWADGVLTWEYCPSGMHCITQSTVSISGDTLTVNWAWSDGGNSGTSDLQRH